MDHYDFEREPSGASWRWTHLEGIEEPVSFSPFRVHPVLGELHCSSCSGSSLGFGACLSPCCCGFFAKAAGHDCYKARTIAFLL